jgi:hypothetical protein
MEIAMPTRPEMKKGKRGFDLCQSNINLTRIDYNNHYRLWREIAPVSYRILITLYDKRFITMIPSLNEQQKTELNTCLLLLTQFSLLFNDLKA